MNDENEPVNGGTPEVEETEVETEEETDEPEESAVEKKTEDRADFNCPECKGEGINVETNVVCKNCAGTGKV